MALALANALLSGVGPTETLARSSNKAKDALLSGALRVSTASAS